jgi:predicted RNA-binding protein Jag
MEGNNESKRGLYEELRRVLTERGQELQAIEVLLKLIYANYEDTFWKIMLDRMSEPELEEFAELLFEDLMLEGLPLEGPL